MTHPDPVGHARMVQSSTEDAEAPIGHPGSVVAALDEQPAEIQIEYRMDRLAAELDELCKIAAHTETHDLIDHRAAVAIAKRGYLLLQLLKSHEQPEFISHAA